MNRPSLSDVHVADRHRRVDLRPADDRRDLLEGARPTKLALKLARREGDLAAGGVVVLVAGRGVVRRHVLAFGEVRRARVQGRVDVVRLALDAPLDDRRRRRVQDRGIEEVAGRGVHLAPGTVALAAVQARVVRVRAVDAEVRCRPCSGSR